MTQTVLSLLDGGVFFLALIVFAYFFSRETDADNTVSLAQAMHHINGSEDPTPVKTKAAGA